LKYGFIATIAKDEPRPKCILCLETLTIDSIQRPLNYKDI